MPTAQQSAKWFSFWAIHPSIMSPLLHHLSKNQSPLPTKLSAHQILSAPISGQWLQVLSCFWELKLPGLHHGKVFRQWTWVRSPSTWLWWSPTVDNQQHVSATRCCQLQWVLVRKITSVRLLSSLTSMLTSSQVWWLWLWSQWFLSRHHWHNRKALNRSVIGLSGSMRRLLFVLSIISWYRLSRSLS